MDYEFKNKLRAMTFGVPWNLALLTFGSFLVAFSVKAIAVPHGLLTGGMSGIALLCYYAFGGLTTGQWYFLLNLPVFILGWVFVSKRFFFYSLYGMIISAVFIDIIPWSLPMEDIWLAIITGGGIMGAGVGVALRSLGSTGGSDILAVICKEKFNMSLGSFEFWVQHDWLPCRVRLSGYEHRTLFDHHDLRHRVRHRIRARHVLRTQNDHDHLGPCGRHQRGHP